MDRSFDWQVFRDTLPGATRQLAYQCEVDRIEFGCLMLVCDRNAKALVDAFGKKLADQIAPTKLMIRLEG